MAWGRWLSAVLLTHLGVAAAQAQFVYPPPGNGITITYHRRPWPGVFVPFAPAPIFANPYPVVIQQRVIVQYVPPPVVYYVPRQPEYDLSGVDLDLVPTKNGPPKPFDPPKPKVAPDPVPPPAPELPPRKDNPVEESARLLDLGVAAFRAEEYGLAARRFRQAIDVEPAIGRAHFLSSQALFALGKYQLASAAIEAGMRVEPNWPNQPFSPRLELYKGQEGVWQTHLQRLGDAAKAQPKNAVLLFLYGHQLWFDGQRAQAVKLFEQARQTATDPAFIDAFLKAAGAGVVAAK